MQLRALWNSEEPDGNERQEDGNEEKTVNGSDHHRQPDGLEESEDYVRIHSVQHGDSQNGR